MKRAWTIFAGLALAACGSRDTGSPGPASVGEERALSDAGEMIARGRPTGPPAPSTDRITAAPATTASPSAR
jgi:hypothetical protein